MGNSKASNRLMDLMAETVSLLGSVKDIREGLDSDDSENTLDALEHVQLSFVQAFDALKIAENEAVGMEARERAEADEDETPTLIFPLCDVLGLPV